MTREEAQKLLGELQYYTGHLPIEKLMEWGKVTLDRLVDDPVLAADIQAAISELLNANPDGARKRARGARLMRRGIPQILHPELLGERRLDHDTEAMQVVREWLAGDRWMLVLVGQNGPGKSLAAAWAIDTYDQRPDGRPPYFLTLTEAYEYNMFNGDADHLYEAPLLCIDECGRTYDDRKEFLRKKMETLLFTRYDRRLRTIITSNLTCNEKSNELGEFLGMGVWDRVLSSHVVHEVLGQSLRRFAV